MKIQPRLLILITSVLICGCVLGWVSLQKNHNRESLNVSLTLTGLHRQGADTIATFSISNSGASLVYWEADARREQRESVTVYIDLGDGAGLLPPQRTTNWQCIAADRGVEWQACLWVQEPKTPTDDNIRWINSRLPAFLRLPTSDRGTRWSFMSDPITNY